MTTASQHIGAAFNGVSEYVGEHALYPGLRLIYSNDELAGLQGANNDWFHGLADVGDEISEFYRQGHVLSGIGRANLGLIFETAQEGLRNIKDYFYGLLQGQYWNNIVAAAAGALVGMGAGTLASRIPAPIPLPLLSITKGVVGPIGGGFAGGLAGFAYGDEIMGSMGITLEPVEPYTDNQPLLLHLDAD